MIFMSYILNGVHGFELGATLFQLIDIWCHGTRLCAIHGGFQIILAMRMANRAGDGPTYALEVAVRTSK